MKKMIAFAFVALLALPAMASAQLLSVSADVGAGLTQVLDAGPGMTYDLVVTLDSGPHSPAAAEFVMSELTLLAPGVFKLLTTKINDTPLELGNNALGEYVMAFGQCETPGVMEIVRVNYGNFQGSPAADTVIALRGLQPGDTQPSSFGGEVGIVDCVDVKFVGQMGGTDGGITGAGVEFPDGGMVINPTPIVVPTEAGSMGSLKARF